MKKNLVIFLCCILLVVSGCQKKKEYVKDPEEDVIVTEEFTMKYNKDKPYEGSSRYCEPIGYSKSENKIVCAVGKMLGTNPTAAYYSDRLEKVSPDGKREVFLTGLKPMYYYQYMELNGEQYFAGYYYLGDVRETFNEVENFEYFIYKVDKEGKVKLLIKDVALENEIAPTLRDFKGKMYANIEGYKTDTKGKYKKHNYLYNLTDEVIASDFQNVDYKGESDYHKTWQLPNSFVDQGTDHIVVKMTHFDQETEKIKSRLLIYDGKNTQEVILKDIGVTHAFTYQGKLIFTYCDRKDALDQLAYARLDDPQNYTKTDHSGFLLIRANNSDKTLKVASNQKTFYQFTFNKDDVLEMRKMNTDDLQFWYYAFMKGIVMPTTHDPGYFNIKMIK